MPHTNHSKNKEPQQPHAKEDDAMATNTNLKVKAVPSREERLHSLIMQYADLQQEEAGIKKAKDFLRAEIESLFPPIPDGEKEVKVDADGATAKLYYPETTVVDPERLWTLEDRRDAFWRLVKIPSTEAKAILPGDVLHAISRVEVSPKAQLLIRRSASKEDR